MEGDFEKADQVFLKELATVSNREAFLIEHSVGVHERRHFVDFTSTTYGFQIFRSTWAYCGMFFNLLCDLSVLGSSIRIPLVKWAASSECPVAVREFMQDYKMFGTVWKGLLTKDAFHTSRSQKSLRDTVP